METRNMDFKIKSSGIQEHEIQINGKIFNEKKIYAKEFGNSSNEDGPYKFSHMRKINDHYYNYTQTRLNGEIKDRTEETNMNAEELDKFTKEWKATWQMMNYPSSFKWIE